MSNETVSNTSQILRWENKADLEIIRGHIPEPIELHGGFDSWLRVKPTGSDHSRHGIDIGLRINNAIELIDRFKPEEELGYRGSRFNYHREPYDSLKGESPLLFWGHTIIGGKLMNLEGIHFRSGNILGAVAIIGGNKPKPALQSFYVEPPTEEILQKHREQVALITGDTDPFATNLSLISKAFIGLFRKK